MAYESGKLRTRPATRKCVPPTKLRGYSYDVDEVYAARDSGKLLCMRLDTNYECNISCRYCYSSPLQNGRTSQMPFSMLKDIVDQACQMGLKSIVYLGGGEPLLYRHFWDFMEYLKEAGVIPVIFTNGTLISKSVAKSLYHVGASVIIKYDGPEDIQDALTGKGTFRKIHSGFQALMKAGYSENDGETTRIGAAPCACTKNYRAIPDIWRFLRKNGVYPNVERASSIGRAEVSDLVLDNVQTKWLMDTLRKIDELEFGIEWDSPYSGYPGHSCYIFLIGCHIKADGGIAVCSEFPPIANIKDKPLREVLTGHPFNKLRYIERYISEPCSSCSYLRTCVGGCRSKCFVSSGSLYGCDPFCTLCVQKSEARSELGQEASRAGMVCHSPLA